MEKSVEIITDAMRHIKEFKELRDEPLKYKLWKVVFILIEIIQYYFGYFKIFCLVFTIYILFEEKFKIFFLLVGLILWIEKFSRDWVGVTSYIKDEKDEKKGIIKRPGFPNGRVTQNLKSN